MLVRVIRQPWADDVPQRQSIASSRPGDAEGLPRLEVVIVASARDRVRSGLMGSGKFCSICVRPLDAPEPSHGRHALDARVAGRAFRDCRDRARLDDPEPGAGIDRPSMSWVDRSDPRSRVLSIRRKIALVDGDTKVAAVLGSASRTNRKSSRPIVTVRIVAAGHEGGAAPARTPRASA